jgi:hypothetical protein
MKRLSAEELDLVRSQPFYTQHLEFDRHISYRFTIKSTIWELFDQGYDPTTVYKEPSFLCDYLYETTGIMKIFDHLLFHGERDYPMYDLHILDPIFERFSLTNGLNAIWKGDNYKGNFSVTRSAVNGPDVLKKLFIYFIRQHHWTSPEFPNMIKYLHSTGLQSCAKCLENEIIHARKRNLFIKNLLITKFYIAQDSAGIIIEFFSGEYN